MSSPHDAWARYLDSFHAHRPGITESVLGRCTDGNGANPYAWLTDGINAGAPVLDIACGSGPTRPCVAGSWLGVDRSTAELRRASQHGRTALVRADATRVPVRDGSVDTVLCSMALMLIDPCSVVLDEINRVLTPSGQLRIMLPTTRPLILTDRWRYLRLVVAARASPRFPRTPLRRHAMETLAAAGFTIASDQSQRFAYPIDTQADVERFVDSWYQPTKPLSATARRRPRDRLFAPRAIGVPLRRIIARKAPDANAAAD